MKYIDLRLPSGTLWAENNEPGYYNFYNAISKFRNQLPTLEQYKELREFTLHKFDNKQKGMWFLGRSGNELFLPAAGFVYKNSLYHAGVYGRYLSTTTNDLNYTYHHLLFDCENLYLCNYCPCDYMFAIRLIKNL